MENNHFNVRSYRAFGDGKTKDTAAIQQAIDECSGSGGGVVLIPSGTYLSGTIWLKDNVELRLERGAEIKASPDLADYNSDDAFLQNWNCPEEEVSGAHLIIALECRNAAITGLGVINGNNDAYFDTSELKGRYWNIKTRRPAQMVFFCECENVSIENVSLIDPTYWSLYLYGCDDVRVRGLRIHNSFAARNGDGIDIDCCRNVTVSDCIIHSGDDCLTIRGDKNRLRLPRKEIDKDATRNINCADWTNKPEIAKCSENICVSNCVLSSSCCAIRIGVGDGEIKNCTLNNIVISNSRFGINLISKFSNYGICGTTISNIRFSNFIINACMPFTIMNGNGSQAEISNIFLNDISVTGAHCSYICGEPDMKIRNVLFKNINFTLRCGKNNIADENDKSLTQIERDVRRPAAFYCRNVTGLAFENVVLDWQERSNFRHDIILDKTMADIRELRSNGSQYGITKSICQLT